MNTFCKPKRVRIESSTACQLKCPDCPTAHGRVSKGLGTGFLRARDLEAFLDKTPWLREVELSNWGEVFLNPELPQILALANSRGLLVTISNGANLNHATEEALEAVVRNGVRYLSCSIDGATQETYATYRVNGNLTKVLSNVRRLQSLKKIYRTSFPTLRWQFIAFGHNEHEIEAARSLAMEHGMEFWVKLAWEDLYGPRVSAPIVDRDRIRCASLVNSADRHEYERLHRRGYIDETCHQMWIDPQLNYDGRVLGCCLNFSFNYGNAFEEGLDSVLAGHKMQVAREMLMGREARCSEIPCHVCPIYLSRKRRKAWVNPDEFQ